MSTPRTNSANLQRWHEFIDSQDPETLRGMLHEDAVFHSPVVHTPQRGRDLVFAYLSAAGEVLGDGFSYLREFDCGDRAVLEFATEVDGIHINGVDLIEWDEDGLITDFKVMVRPLRAIQMVHGKMAEMLERMAAERPGA